MFQHCCGCTCASITCIYAVSSEMFSEEVMEKTAMELRSQGAAEFTGLQQWLMHWWLTGGAQFVFSSSCPLRHTRTNTPAARFPFRKHD